jgi:hypothetical protein
MARKGGMTLGAGMHPFLNAEGEKTAELGKR